MAENIATWGEAATDYRERMQAATARKVGRQVELNDADWSGTRPIGLTSPQARMLSYLLDDVMNSPTAEVRVNLIPGQRRALRGVLDEVERITTRGEAA